MVGLGSELTTKAGPLPVWAWGGIGVVGLSGYLIYRKKQAMNADMNQQGSDTSSTVMGAPSNLSVQAQPMPFQMGDTFVNDNDTNNINLPCPQGVKPTVGGQCPPGPPVKVNPKPPTLPTVNPAKYPAKVKKNSALGKTMIQIGCWSKDHKYTGHNVTGHVPVYGYSAATQTYAQGPLATSAGHCVFIPGEFKAYIK